MEARGRREVKERRRRGRSGARRGTGGRRRKGKKREVGNEVEKRVSGEKKKGREEKRGGVEAYEYPVRMRRGTRGRMVMMRANDRRVMYRGRERSGLSMYVLAARRRGSAYSTEAGVKYYVVGVVGSGRRLYGRTRRYGAVGTRNRLERKRREGGEGRKRKRGRRRVSGARRRKRGAVPRHRWVADVYEGAPSGAGRYFAVVPKRARRVRRVRRGGGRERRGEVVEEGYRRRARRGVRSGLVGAFNYLRRAKRSMYEEGKEEERGGRRRRGKKEEEKREVERTKEETRGRGRGRGRRRRRRRNPMGRLERGTKRGLGRRR